MIVLLLAGVAAKRWLAPLVPATVSHGRGAVLWRDGGADVAALAGAGAADRRDGDRRAGTVRSSCHVARVRRHARAGAVLDAVGAVPCRVRRLGDRTDRDRAARGAVVIAAATAGCLLDAWPRAFPVVAAPGCESRPGRRARGSACRCTRRRRRRCSARSRSGGRSSTAIAATPHRSTPRCAICWSTTTTRSSIDSPQPSRSRSSSNRPETPTAAGTRSFAPIAGQRRWIRVRTGRPTRSPRPTRCRPYQSPVHRSPCRESRRPPITRTSARCSTVISIRAGTLCRRRAERRSRSPSTDPQHVSAVVLCLGAYAGSVSPRPRDRGFRGRVDVVAGLYWRHRARDLRCGAPFAARGPHHAANPPRCRQVPEAAPDRTRSAPRLDDRGAARHRMRLSGTARAVALATLAYIVLTIAYSWPLPINLMRGVAHDPGDPILNAWILWWTTQAVPLTARGGTRRCSIPQPARSRFRSTCSGQAPIAAPLIALTGSPLFGYNVTLLATYVLSGLGAYFLAYTLTRRHDASFVAGLAFAFAPYRVAQLPHIQVLTAFWTPVCLAALHRYDREPSTRWAALAAARVADAVAVERLLHVLPDRAAGAVVRMVRDRRAGRCAQIARLAGFFVVAAVLLLPDPARLQADPPRDVRVQPPPGNDPGLQRGRRVRCCTRATNSGSGAGCMRSASRKENCSPARRSCCWSCSAIARGPAVRGDHGADPDAVVAAAHLRGVVRAADYRRRCCRSSMAPGG